MKLTPFAKLFVAAVVVAATVYVVKVNVLDRAPTRSFTGTPYTKGGSVDPATLESKPTSGAAGQPSDAAKERLARLGC